MIASLLLDRNYMALSIVPWKRAVKLLVKGKAEVVESGKELGKVRCTSGTFNVPSIIRLTVNVPYRSRSGKSGFSRKNVLLRDDYLCSYCGVKVSKNASIDHVLPKSRGGKTTYLNCVTCCKKCNGLKGNRTPEEARMVLLKKPRNPSFFNLYRNYLVNAPEKWKEYIIGF
jgi:5-methylcytosine-specific restriction endonuclease McrA